MCFRKVPLERNVGDKTREKKTRGYFKQEGIKVCTQVRQTSQEHLRELLGGRDVRNEGVTGMQSTWRVDRGGRHCPVSGNMEGAHLWGKRH